MDHKAYAEEQADALWPNELEHLHGVAGHRGKHGARSEDHGAVKPRRVAYRERQGTRQRLHQAPAYHGRGKR